MKPLAMGLLPPRLALRFILNQPVSCAIPGPTRLEWLEENIAAAEGPLELTDDEQAEIERLRLQHDGSRCRLCYLCQPCPLDVPIAYSLGTYRFYNDFRNMGKEVMQSFPYGEWARKHLPEELARITAGVDRCNGCGQCEPRCPYGLPIVEMLRGMKPALGKMREIVSAW